ncbi:MAG: flagellar hook-associated protein FlgK [Desulfohalobiaceae bacterium]
MPGVNSILDIGRWALFASQSQIEVTGNNIANVNTPGYVRRSVVMEEGQSIDYNPGQMGTGVRATEVVRHFDAFVEEQYNNKSANREMWLSLQDNLSALESIFNESAGEGINASLSQFFAGWQALSTMPRDSSTRAALLGQAQNLVSAIGSAATEVGQIQGQMNALIAKDVQDINTLITQIAEVNAQIIRHEEPGQNNPNELYDRRDQLTRELAERIDIEVIDNGGGRRTILTRAGHTLVDGVDAFELRFESAKTFKDLVNSGSDVDVLFQGSSSKEYTLEVVTGGAIGDAEFRISTDGGSTYLKDANGNDVFTAQDFDNKVVTPDGDLSLWFTGSDDLASGDRFTIVPKEAVYWYETTSVPLNITPLLTKGGELDKSRLTGGSLAGNLAMRDLFAGKYADTLDAFAEGLIWEVNRIHSQGAGLDTFTSVTGTNQVVNPDVALGGASSGLVFGDRLQAGNMTLHVYDSAGQVSDTHQLDFPENFDPAVHSLDDLAAELDGLDNVSASVINNRLSISASDGHSLAFGTDTTGLLAALGVNTFFSGTDAATLTVSPEVLGNTNLINAGHVNGAGESNPGDNQTALSIAQLQHEKVALRSGGSTTQQTLQSFYNSLVSGIGTDLQGARFSYQQEHALAQELHSAQEAVAGVNLDEEMSSLIKYQHAYRAAAKLIVTADEMLDTVLGMRR